MRPVRENEIGNGLKIGNFSKLVRNKEKSSPKSRFRACESKRAALMGGNINKNIGEILETNVTITMTLEEYAAYKEQRADFKKEYAEREVIQHDCEILAKMVCREVGAILDGKKTRLGLCAANLIYNKAEAILNHLQEG